MKNQTGLQFNRSEFFVTERTDGILDRDSIELKMEQLNDLMEEIAIREKQLVSFRDKLELPPVEVSVDNLIVHEDVQDIERTANGRRIRKDKGLKRIEKFKGHYKTKKNGEKIWVPPGTRKAKGRKLAEVLKENKREQIKEARDKKRAEKVKEQEFLDIPVLEEVVDKPVEQTKQRQKKKGHYRTNSKGIRYYVGKKPLSLKLKELVGLA